ncbi:response regulator transcription factor [Streptomyces sp. NPDC045431]|uniref:response regulator transcription factor n=1 Tax=Streptomyces sp. NPDC045431 TaxID=3155613 RepID=UPI0034057E6C
MTVRVLLADDQALIRGGLRSLIESEPGLEVAGEAADGSQAVDMTRALAPDVVLMDIRMPGTDGLEATREICADPALTATKVVVLTTFGQDDYVLTALKAGASGFMMKDTEPRELLSAIRTVAAGDSLLLPRRTRHLVEKFVHRESAAPTGPVGLDLLSPREREVLALVGRGHSNDEIAAMLHLSPLTAKTHVSRILTKLAARDRAQLVVIAYESGLLRPGHADA